MRIYDPVELARNLDDIEVWANEGGFEPGDFVVARGRVGTVCEQPRALITGGRVGVWVEWVNGGAVTTPVAKVRRWSGGAR